MRDSFTFAALLCATIASPVQAAEPAQVEAALKAVQPAIQVAGRDYQPVPIEALMKRHNVPGLSIALIRDGRIAWTGTYGVADKATGRPVTRDTLFQAASISKPVAATAALDLVEQGRLDLDRPIDAQLKSWKLPASAEAAGEPITLRRLLTHTAGLTVHGFPGYAPGTKLPSVVQVLDGAAPANTDPVRIDLKPGSKWRYSGGGITVAQLLMTDVTGESFPALMERLVLKPLGMNRSTFAQPLPQGRAGEAALAYGGDGKPVPGGYHAYPEMAAAGLWTTPSDLARWALAISAAYQGESGSVLEPGTAVAMLTPGMGDWGLGLSVSGEGEWLEFGHNGANEGYRTNLVSYPRRGEGVVVMTNGDNGGPLVGAVMLAVGKTMGWPRSEPRIIKPAPISAEERAAVLGRYKGETFSFTIAEQGDRLIATPTLGAPFELIPLGEDAYGSPDIGMRVKFQRGADGKITGVSGGGMTLTREP